jgi:hypothetical protein
MSDEELQGSFAAGFGTSKVIVVTLTEAIEGMFDRTVCATCQTHLKYLLILSIIVVTLVEYAKW